MDNVEEIRNQLFNFVGPIGITQHLVPHVDQLCRMVKDSQSQIATLTDERDVAREERDRFINYSISLDARHHNDQQVVARLTTELAALRSAPGMDDVDVCYQRSRDLGPTECRVEELSDIARRAIVSRDEVVGLLQFIDSDIQPILSLVRELSDCDGEIGVRCRRILEIVEGK